MINSAVLLDTETTGLGKKDRVIELGFMVFEASGEDLRLYQNLCKPDVEIGIDAMSVNNITPEMLEKEKPIKDTDTYKKLIELNNENNYLVMHNAPFDLKMLKKDGFDNKMKVIDTLVVCKHLFPSLKKKSLQYLRYAFKIYQYEEQVLKKYKISGEFQPHTVSQDVLVLYLLFRKLLSDNGMEKLVELSGTDVILSRMPFGKHQNETFEMLAKNSPQYLYWVIMNVKNCSNDIKTTIKHWIKKIYNQNMTTWKKEMKKKTSQWKR